MIFAAIGRGKYCILESDEVVANIYRTVEYGRKPWPVRWWVVDWRGTHKEKFASLPFINDKYKFKNYPGYQHVLDHGRNYVES